MKRLPLITSFILFIALCASVTYWALQLFSPPQRAVAALPQASRPAPALEAAASLLGGHPTAVVASNYQLKGVVVAGNPAESVAVLVANGKPPKAVRVNRVVIPGVTLHEVQRDYVLLLEGSVVKRVELPLAETRNKMATGVSGSAKGTSLAPAVAPAQTNSAQSYPPQTHIRSGDKQQSSEPTGNARFREGYAREFKNRPADGARNQEGSARERGQNRNNANQNSNEPSSDRKNRSGLTQ